MTAPGVIGILPVGVIYLDRAGAVVSGHLDAIQSPLLQKALHLYAYAALTSVWAAVVVRRVHPGLQRLLAVLPIVICNLLAPLLLDPSSEPLLITPLAGVFSLAAFKLLAFSIGRGPLMPEWLTSLQFACVYLLPIIPIQVFTVGPSDTARMHTIKQRRRLMFDSLSNTGIAMLVSWVLALPSLPVMVRHWLYTLASATFLTAVFEILGAVAYWAVGITAAPSFDRPWLSESFQDFWARRWNLTTTYMMRVLVYEPVIEGRVLPVGARRAKLSAVAAAASPIVAGKSSPGRPQRQGAEEGAIGRCLAPADEAAAAAENAPEVATAAAAGPAENISTLYGESPTSASPTASDYNGLRQRRKATEPFHEDVNLQDSSRVNGHRTPAAAATVAGTVASTAANIGGETGKVRPVSKLRRFVGLQAVFLFSGLWHILIFWYNTHVFSWRWCAFFTVQAPILMFERLLRQVGRRMGVRVPHALQVFAANFLLIAVARPLFFGPTDTTGFAARNLAVGQAPLWALVKFSRPLAERFWSSAH